MATVDLTNITPPRVPLIDPRTGLISREWYRFFLNLFQLVGSGQNTTSLTDLQLGPPALAQEDITDVIIDVEATQLQPTEQSAIEQIAELQKQVNGLAATPAPALGTMAALQQDNLPWVTFDIAPESVPTAIGTTAWDGGSTLGIQATANVIIRIGESEFVYVKASSAITKGQLCYHTGAVGGSGVITAAPTPLALADPNQIVGVAAESIALNGFGLIQISGDLRGFNTTGSSVGETWADGDPLYYNPAYVGSFTKTKPSAPNQKTYIGEVINAGSGGSGSINVRIIPGSVLGGTDSNVQFSGLANNDLIQYDSTLQYWKNVPASTLPVGTATNLAGGVAGSVPYQTAPSTTTFLPIGTAAQVLKVNAGATAPEWVSGAALTKTDDTNVTLTLGGTPATSLLAATSLTLGWTGQLAATRGGTGFGTYAVGDVLYASSTTALSKLGLGTAYQVLGVNAGATAPSWQPSATSVLTTQGDLLYASAANTLARLAKNTTATRYLSNTGTSNNPAWAQIDLSNGVTGTLPVGNGGTGQASNLTQYGVIYGSTTTAMASTAAGTSTQVLHGNASGAPTWGAVSLTADVSGTLPIANGGTNATATPTAGGVAYGTGTAYAFTAAGTSNYLLQSAGSGAPTWSNSINGITIGASTAAAGSFTTLTATLAQASSTPIYHQIKTGGYSYGGGTQDAGGIVEGAWFIDTADSNIAPIAIASGAKWRVILIGSWGNYYEGFGVNGPGNYCEVTSDSNTIAVGSRTVTITRNGTTGYLQWNSSPTYGSMFQGTIIISQSGGAPSYAFNVKGGMLALGVYSTTVGATNRDVYVDDTGVIGYVSSTRESKTNIKSLDDVSWLMQLDPVQFNRRKKKPVFAPDNDKLPIGETYSDEAYEELEYGLIADDAQNVNDELCFYDIDNDGAKILRGVHYSKLITPLLKMVQKQQNELDVLKSELAALKAGDNSPRN